MADRFDMPRLMREFLNTAIRDRTIDSAEMWVLACNHGTDWTAMRETVMSYAFMRRHGPSGLAAHRELCKLNDECYRVLVAKMEPTLHFD